MSKQIRALRVPDLKEKKVRGEKITALTAYDTTIAALLDRAGIDIVLVGDSLGTVILGYDTTLPVTLEMMVHHTRAVSRGVLRALVVADMPFLTYQVSLPATLRNAGRLIQEGGASAVKVEGAGSVLKSVRHLVDVGIPVMGHLGLTPQKVHTLGGHRPQACKPDEVTQLLTDAVALENVGIFALVLESIPDEVALEVTSRLSIPTIGIGAGPGCDGQILVTYDAFGLFDSFVPPFVKRYASLANTILDATGNYIEDVRKGRFPVPRTTPSSPSKNSKSELIEEEP